jgi:glycosyltransferase involved in cell wall biosynthesis
MDILYFTKYSRKAASSRMRSFQYFPYLEKHGMNITVKPLFNDNYLKSIYEGKKSKIHVIQAYLSRLWALFSVYKYDKVVIEKELFPYMPAFFEWLFHLFNVKYIVDYDDAIFHNYDQHPSTLIKTLLGNKISSVMRYSYAVVAGNEYLAAKAFEAGAINVFIIPTVIDLDRYTKSSKQDNKIIIGWIGTRSTFEKHLFPKKDWIKKAIAKHGVEFHVVGVTNDLGLGEGVLYFPWSELTEVNSILNFDVGIMPLEDSLWEKGKCSYKLIQYMACGLPVIASPVGMNNEVVQENVNGFLVRNEQEWLEAIEHYVKERTLRIDHGRKGRISVEQKYCLQVTAPQLLNIIRL